MIVFFITSLLLVIGFSIFACIRIGYIPDCLSRTYYLLPSHGWLFQIAMIAGGMALLPAWLEVSPTAWQFLVFLSCAGIMFVGAAPMFLRSPQTFIHYGATIIAALSAILWCIFAVKHGWIPLAILLTVAAILTLKKAKQALFFFEMAAFIAVYTAIFIEMLK